MFRLLWNVSRPDLAARPARVALFVVAVCTGVAMMTAMRAATDVVVAGFSSDLEQLGGRADLQITFGTGEASFPEDTLELLAGQPFIAHSAALVRGSLTFSDGSGETLELFGVDLLQADVRDIYNVEVVEREIDDFTIINDPYAVFLTREIASERGLALGDTVEFSAVNGIHTYTVRGILGMHGLAQIYGGRLAAMYLPAAQAVAGKEGNLYSSQIDQIDLVLSPSVDLEQARKALAAVLPPSLSVSEPLQRKAAGERTVAGLRATLIGMSSFALLAAMFIVYATTAALVKNRLPTMGTLLSIGARPQRLVAMILLEAAVLGFAGAVAGVLIGLLLASFIRGDIAAGMSLNYSLLFSSDAGESVSHAFAFWYPLLGAAAAVCSAWVPARGLLREDPLAIGRHGASPESGEMPPFAQVLAAAFAMMCLGSLAVAAGVNRQSAVLCTAGGIALLLSSIIAAAPAIRILWDALGAPLTRGFGIGGRIAAESLTRDANRSVVTVTAIALCISVAVGASTLALSFRRSITHWYGFSGDAVIASRATKGGWLGAPLSSGLEAQIASLPAAARVEVLRVSQGNLYGGSRIAVVGLSDSVAAEAVDAAALDAVLGPGEALASFSAGRGVLVSENFAAHFERGPGSNIDLDAPSGAMRLPVLGVVADFVSDKGSVIMSRGLYRDR